MIPTSKGVLPSSATCEQRSSVALRGLTVAALALASLTALGCEPATTVTVAAPTNRVDRIRPDAPELAAFGKHDIGVRTLELVNPDQIDLLAIETAAQNQAAAQSGAEQDGAEQNNAEQDEAVAQARAAKDEDLPRADRSLIVEVWYPAMPGGEPAPYKVFLRDGATAVEIHGQAVRDAAPAMSEAPYPVILISHGFPGNRFLLSHLAENLATKGYVVASIDHTDSTYRTRAAFSSTLVNRPLDQRFVLDEIARLSQTPGEFLNNLADADTAGLVGYSMGGYGAMITAGAGITQEAVDRGAPRNALAMHRDGAPEFTQRFDDRIKAIVAFAPWGMTVGFWDQAGLAGVKVPILFVAGSADDVSGYEGGVRALFEQAINVERHLLTFDNANHNAAAPMPAPTESRVAHGEHPATFGHYADAVWDTVRMNNVAQHFATAYFGKELKGDEAMVSYLELTPRSADGPWSMDDEGTPTASHTYWKGFANRTATGLRLERLPRQEAPAQR